MPAPAVAGDPAFPAANVEINDNPSNAAITLFNAFLTFT
jgi:hypothetical protein